MIGVVRTRALGLALCTLALVTWTLLPAQSAWANPGNADRSPGAEAPGQTGQQGTPARAGARDRDAGSASQDAPRRAERGEEARSSGSGTAATPDRGNSAGAPHGQSNGHPRAGDRRGDDDNSSRGAAHETRGDHENQGTPNRGSVKVRTTGEEADTPRTEPHVGCEFWIHFHGFDADEARDFRLLAFSPTGDGEEVYAGTIALDSARGNDYSGIYPSGDGLTPADLGLAAFEPHEQQGWHLRLEVDGPKHKMFWVDCPAGGGDETGIGGELDDEVLDDAIEVPVEQREEFGIGGGYPSDEAAVLGLILEHDEATEGVESAEVLDVRAVGPVFGLGGAEPTDAEVVAASTGNADTLAVTGAHLGWLAALGVVLGAVGVRLSRSGRAQPSPH